ncbi:3-isopropylmalate dehydrogenase [Virgibacillus dokdonensis]|uniref:3-isopropylmalate dehydrogenase n=1 Tax=Virgibacillus dokdonensis TaxID=302167 RepID=A0ABU7VKX6_9BACI
MNKQIVILPGDGIGKEIMDAAVRVLQAIAENFNHQFTFSEHLIGGAAIDGEQSPLPETTIHACKKADAVLLGAVGGEKWDALPGEKRPEKGLLGIRKELGLFANLRPIKAFTPLLHASPLKEEIVEGSNILIIRELTGGLYFGEPKKRIPEENAVVDTLYYTQTEIERIVDKAFQTARTRKKRVTSVDKANVLESSRVWREVVEEKSKQYPDIAVDHLLVDAAAMKLITNPKQFDVIVTENMFGDILSDEASVLTGSLGMLPSASVRTDGVGLYEPVHGSAPDIAGKGIANPLGMILSASSMLRQSFGMEQEADEIEYAVQMTLEQGYHTPDLSIKNGTVVGTKEMTDIILGNLATNDASQCICNSYA